MVNTIVSAFGVQNSPLESQTLPVLQCYPIGKDSAGRYLFVIAVPEMAPPVYNCGGDGGGS